MNIYSLNETEVRIYNYITKQVSEFKEPRLIDVADANFVSTTYVIKTAKKLGFSGYSELLFSLKHGERRHQNQDEVENSLNTMADELATLVLKYQTKGVHVFGIGYSAILAEYFSKKLMSFHIFASDTSPRDLKKNISDYLVIYISNSGETEDVLEIARVLSGKCHQVLLTSASTCSIMNRVNNSYRIENKASEDAGKVDRFDSNCLLMIELMTQKLKIKLD